ncbi:hypothetical protein [Natrarchaeobaculum aegyptiacum]|uniref:hypothetical protein n=1 Tax=Natrarchaeobaculum aegyptiacum TaxID=745377 RepID=UPI001E52BA91|nr:hypothetical protein [Natrarchaeobaculum aegyptiacum]
MIALVLDLAVHSLVLTVDVGELVSMRATATARRGKAVVQAGTFAVQSSHLLAVCELDELWRGSLLTLVSDHHGSHVFSHPGVKRQYAVCAVSRLRVFDFGGEGQFVIGVTGLSTSGLKLGSREIAVSEEVMKRLVAVTLVLCPRPVTSCLRRQRVRCLETNGQRLTVGVVLVFDGLAARWAVVRRKRQYAAIVLWTVLHFEIRGRIRAMTVVVAVELVDEDVHVSRREVVTVTPELFFDATTVDTSDFMVGQHALEGLEGVSAVGVTSERFTDFLQDAPSKPRGEIQAEFVERFVFIEVIPCLMRCVGNAVQMDWRPVVFKDMVGDTTGECCQSIESFVVLIWEVNREREVVTHRFSPQIRRC